MKIRVGLSTLLFCFVLSHAAHSGLCVPSDSLEQALFEDAADGKFHRLSLEHSVLIASGVSQKELPLYLSKIDALYNRMVLQYRIKNLSDLRKGFLILSFLHKNVFKIYDTSATEIQITLNTGRYNCVSSTLLFNILCTRLGLSTMSVEVPTHLYSILKTPSRNFEVQTTTPNGFLANLSQLNEFIYNPSIQKWKGKRFVNPVSLMAVIYYNRGLRWIREKNYEKALPFYQKAYRLDPEFPDLASLILDLYICRGNQFFENHEYSKAASIYQQGLPFLKQGERLSQNAFTQNLAAAWINQSNTHMQRKDWLMAQSLLQKAEKLGTLKSLVFHNQKVLFYEWGKSLIDRKIWHEALKVYRQAQKIFPHEKGFQQNLVWVYAKIGDELLKKGKTKEAKIWFIRAFQETRDPTFYKVNQWLKKI